MATPKKIEENTPPHFVTAQKQKARDVENVSFVILGASGGTCEDKCAPSSLLLTTTI